MLQSLFVNQLIVTLFLILILQLFNNTDVYTFSSLHPEQGSTIEISLGI